MSLSFLRRSQRIDSLSRTGSRQSAAWLAFPLSVLVAAACTSEDAEPNYVPGDNPVMGTTAGGTPGGVAGNAGGTTGNTSPGTTAGASTGTTAGTSTGGTPGASVTGGVGGTAGTGSTAGTGGVAGATGGATAGFTGGATAGATGGTTAGTTGGTTAGATGGATAGAGMPGGGAALKPMCQSGETMGCSSFVAPSGKEIPFGPYGAAMDVNVGKGFELPIDPSDNTEGCRSFASIFGQPQEETDRLLDLKGTDLKLYTVFRPANWKEGEKYPLITWGNGTCAQPEGYGTLLRFIASHGFVVVAGNSRYVGSTKAMTKALDFMFKANEDMTSPYYQKLDLVNVGAMGHSQGGAATVEAAKDARIKSVILFNGGTSTPKPYMVVSGDNDIPFVAPSAADMKSNVNRASKAAYLFFHMIPAGGSFKGHLTLMQQPERLIDAAAAWWRVLLKDDTAAKEYFVGTSCKLCGKASDFEFGQNGIQ